VEQQSPEVGPGVFHAWSDSIGFTKTRDALGGLGIGPEEQGLVFKVLAAILHLGNIRFVGA
jgi:myosin heavy subunit